MSGGASGITDDDNVPRNMYLPTYTRLKTANAALTAENERLTLKCEDWEMRLQSEAEHTAHLTAEVAELKRQLAEMVPVVIVQPDIDKQVTALRQRVEELEGLLRECLTGYDNPDRDAEWDWPDFAERIRAALSTPSGEATKEVK